jgi:hypothetical protein
MIDKETLARMVRSVNEKYRPPQNLQERLRVFVEENYMPSYLLKDTIGAVERQETMIVILWTHTGQYSHKRFDTADPDLKNFVREKFEIEGIEGVFEINGSDANDQHRLEFRYIFKIDKLEPAENKEQYKIPYKTRVICKPNGEGGSIIAEMDVNSNVLDDHPEYSELVFSSGERYDINFSKGFEYFLEFYRDKPDNL